MKLSLRAGLVLLGAAGFCVALGVMASADVVDPASAYQPASTELMSKESPSGESLVPSAPLDGEFFASDSSDEATVATPAPEQIVAPAPARITQRATTHEGSALDRAVHNVRAGLSEVGAVLGRVASACQVGVASGTGGPVLVLAVMCMAAALARRRSFFARSAIDEDMPELLYAWEITPPG